jgi:hypothetical protein
VPVRPGRNWAPSPKSLEGSLYRIGTAGEHSEILKDLAGAARIELAPWASVKVICVCARMCVSLHMCACACLFVCVCVCACICARVFVCLCVCECVYSRVLKAHGWTEEALCSDSG